MEKQRITRQDIKRDLLAQIHKGKRISAFLTGLTIVAILLYGLYIVKYGDIMALYASDDHIGRGFHPAWGLFIIPVFIFAFVFFLLDFYYIDLCKATTGNFGILEERLVSKNEESIRGYRCAEKRAFLCFRCGRVAIQKEIYSRAVIGDTFYVIVTRYKKAPRLVYHTNYYEVDH